MKKHKIFSKYISSKQKKELYSLFPSVFDEKKIDKKKFNLIFENNRPPKILYHYTSLDTFQTILKQIEVKEKAESDINKKNPLTLRGTHIEYLNDFAEFKEAAKLMAELFKEYEKSLPNDKNKRLADKLNKSYWESLVTFHGLKTPPFITSFSEESDNLPMWNTYGHSGKGVAIGIEKLNLNDLNYQNDSEKPAWGKCVYDRKPLKDYLYPMIEDLYNRFEYKNGRFIIHGAINFTEIEKLFSILKHFAYDYEQEWRLIKICSSNDTEKQIKFHETNGLIKPYIEHQFPKKTMKEVVIGPCSDMDLSIKSIKMSLKRAGYYVDKRYKKEENFVSVKCSEVPYRLL